MDFSTEHALNLLGRTPGVLHALLNGLPEGWGDADEGPGTWSPREIIGHLILGEQTDWMVRTRQILDPALPKAFEPFDMEGHGKLLRGKAMEELLRDFETCRQENLRELQALALSKDQLELTGIHPEFGPVPLRQMLATWVVHDLNHLGQLSRVLAGNYRGQVGPWRQYLRILQGR